ncbi:MAG: carbohydrate kinase family protein [Actinomycetota bacterium]
MRVVVIGIANQQTTLPVDRFPVEYVAQRYLTGAIRHTVGGVAFNVARSLCALGHVVALASPLGEDYPAAMIDAEAYRFNLSTHLCRRELARTPRSVVLYDTCGHRQVNSDLTDATSFTFQPEDLEPDLFRAKLVVLANLDMVRPLLEPLRGQGRRVAVDLHDIQGPDNPYDQEFLSATYLNMSNEMIQGDETEVLRALRAKSAAKVLSMTLGADGALVLARDMESPVHVPAPEVRAINTVGAGDTYWAVFLHHLVKEKRDAVVAASLACKAASRMVSTEPVHGSSNVNDLRAILGVPQPVPSATTPAEIGWSSFSPEW